MTSIYFPRVTYLDLYHPAYTPARTKYGIHLVLLLATTVTYLEVIIYNAINSIFVNNILECF